MNTAASAFIVALLLGLVLTPPVRGLAARAGVARTDRPCAGQRCGIPRLGGLAIALAFVAAVAFSLGDGARAHTAVLIGSAPILLLGIYDDLRGADAYMKFTIQIGVGVALFVAGIRVEAVTMPLFGRIELELLAAPITVLWIVAITNAFNLLDGLDGLAAGVGVVTAAALSVIAWLAGDIATATILAALIGALVAFLVFNFYPASVFMGDTGSLFLGYLIAATSLLLCTADTGAARPLTPLLALGLPLLDTSMAFIRRLLRGQHPFRGDREHLHHRLVDSGLEHRAAVLLLYSVAAALGALAVLSAWSAGMIDLLALAGGLACLGLLVRRTRLGRGQHSARSRAGVLRG